MVAGVGIAPTPSAYETDVLLLDHPALFVLSWTASNQVELNGGNGGSRTLVFAVQKRCSPVELHPLVGVERHPLWIGGERRNQTPSLPARSVFETVPARQSGSPSMNFR